MENAQVIINEIIKGQNGKGANFIGIAEYKAKTSGELANHVVNFGVSYGSAKETSVEILESLTDADFDAIEKMFSVNNKAEGQWGSNQGARLFLETGKLPKEGTKARTKVLDAVKDFKTLATVRDEMIYAIKNPKPRDEENFEQIARGVRKHTITNQYHIWAFAHYKDVIEEGEYKESKPNPETLQKNAIRTYCKNVLNKRLPITKFRDFIIDEGQFREVKATGDTFTFLD